MTETPNPFEQVADQQRTAASKARDRAAERRLAKLTLNSDADAPMKATAQEKEQREKQAQLRQWRAWHREESNTLLEGVFGREYQGLLLLLSTLTPDSAPALVKYVERCDWVQKLDRTGRQTVLSVIGDRIMKLRITHGLAPFDDSLPGEEPTAFELCRKHITGVGAWE